MKRLKQYLARFCYAPPTAQHELRAFAANYEYLITHTYKYCEPSYLHGLQSAVYAVRGWADRLDAEQKRKS